MAPNDPVRIVEFDERVASPGMDEAVHNSLAYRIAEIERHLHSNARWFGAAVVANGQIHVADRIGVGVNPFVPDAGNNNWGNWTQILGSSDTPASAGSAYYDLHKMTVVTTERTNVVHFVQFSFGATGAAGLSSPATYTETAFEPVTAAGVVVPHAISNRRYQAGTKAWVRVMVPGQNTGTVSLYFGLHEYAG